MTKDFLHLDVENGALDRFGVKSSWDSMFADTGTTRLFVDGLTRTGRFIVLDWGFPVGCLPIVESLKQAGVEIWWFDGDRDAARQSFIKRGTVPVECLDIQMRDINREWPAIKQVFGDHIVYSVQTGPTYLTSEAVFAKLSLRVPF